MPPSMPPYCIVWYVHRSIYTLEIPRGAERAPESPLFPSGNPEVSPVLTNIDGFVIIDGFDDY